MEHFCITMNKRSDLSVEDTERLLKDLRAEFRECDAFFTREVGTQFGHHWHGLIRLRKTEAACRLFFKRRFQYSADEAKAKMLCVKTWDGDAGWLRYCCKGPNEVEGELPIVVVDDVGRDTNRLHYEYYSSKLERIEQNTAKKKALKHKPSVRKEFVDYALAEGFERKDDLLSLLESFLSEKAREGENLFFTETHYLAWLNAAWFRRFPVRGVNDCIARVRDRWL